MTFSQMVLRVKELLDDSDSSAAYTDRIRHALNVAYLTVARDKWRPVFSEEKDVTDGQISIASLSRSFVSLKTVKTVSASNRLYAWAGKDYIHISAPCTRVLVEYYYLPADLSADTDTPVIPEASVSSYAYIYFAAAQCLSLKHRYTDASVWETKYKNIVDNVSENRSLRVMPFERWS